MSSLIQACFVCNSFTIVYNFINSWKNLTKHDHVKNTFTENKSDQNITCFYNYIISPNEEKTGIKAETDVNKLLCVHQWNNIKFFQLIHQ